MSFLWWAETEHMGLRGDKKRTQEFVERLMYLVNDGTSPQESS